MEPSTLLAVWVQQALNESDYETKASALAVPFKSEYPNDHRLKFWLTKTK